MAIRDHIVNISFSREYACDLILFFLNKKLVTYQERLKAYNASLLKKGVGNTEEEPKDSEYKVTIKEIMDEITPYFIPDFMMPKDKKNLSNIRREITDYVNSLVENPDSHRFLKDNSVLKLSEKTGGQNFYCLQEPLTEITPQDLVTYYEKIQLCMHLLSHLVGVDDMLDGKSYSISKLEKFMSGDLGELGDYAEKNPVLILKTGGFPSKLLASDCQNLMSLIKKAFEEGLQIQFDYKSRNDEKEKHHEFDPIGIDLNIANGTLWLIAATKKPNENGTMVPSTITYRLEKIKNPKLGTKSLLLTEKERAELREYISNDLEGNYIRPEKEIITAKILVEKSFNEYVTYTPWFLKQKFQGKQGDNFVYQVEALKELIFWKVHAARGVATIIDPPELVKEFLEDCANVYKKHESVINGNNPKPGKKTTKKKK